MRLLKSSPRILVLVLLLGCARTPAEVASADSDDSTVNATGVEPSAGGIASADSGDPFVNTTNAPPSVLQIFPSGNGLQISWQVGGALEQAAGLNGPWTTVSNAASPYAIAATNAQMFFRLAR